MGSAGKNPVVGWYSVLQRIFSTQVSNPHSLMSPALAGGFLTTSTNWEAHILLLILFKYYCENEVAQSCLTLCNHCTVACQDSPSLGFTRQEYWSGMPFPSPGDLLDPGIEHRYPTLQGWA